jgi:hypothetical protein
MNHASSLHNESDALEPIVKKYFHSFKDSDANYIESLLSDDATWHMDGDFTMSTVDFWHGKNLLKNG